MVIFWVQMTRKTFCFTCLGLVLGLWLLCDTTRASQWRRVRWVSDGDTVVLSDGTQVRYIGVNAPEIADDGLPAERFGPEARAFNRKLVYKKKVRLELDQERHDQYGRLLAYVFLEDQTFVNAELLRGGYAHYLFHRPNTKYNLKFIMLQREAMAGRVGLWKSFRDQRGPYVGNRRSKRFHQKACGFGKSTSPKNRTIFERKYEAFWAGHSPCKRCNP